MKLHIRFSKRIIFNLRYFAYFILKSYSSILENSTSKYYKSFCLNSYVFLGIMLITLKIYNYLWLPSVFEIQKIMRCLISKLYLYGPTMRTEYECANGLKKWNEWTYIVTYFGIWNKINWWIQRLTYHKINIVSR